MDFSPLFRVQRYKKNLERQSLLTLFTIFCSNPHSSDSNRSVGSIGFDSLAGSETVHLFPGNDPPSVRGFSVAFTGSSPLPVSRTLDALHLLSVCGASDDRETSEYGCLHQSEQPYGDRRNCLASPASPDYCRLYGSGQVL